MCLDSKYCIENDNTHSSTHHSSTSTAVKIVISLFRPTYVLRTILLYAPDLWVECIVGGQLAGNLLSIEKL